MEVFLWLTTRPGPKKSGSNGKTRKKQSSGSWGVDEDTIQRLHVYDWGGVQLPTGGFTNPSDWTSRHHWDTAQWMEWPIRDSISLLEDIDDQQLFQKLSKENRLTLDIVFLRYQGYTYKEIARRMGISESAVRKKISRLRKTFLIFMSQNALSRRL